MAFSRIYKDYGLYLEENAPIFVCGELDKSEQFKIKAAEIYPLREIHKHFTQRISLHIPAVGADDDHLRAIKDVLLKHPGDTPVTLCLMFADGKKVFISADRTYRVNPCHELIQRLQGVLGEESVYLDVNRQPCKKPPGANGRSNGRWKSSRAGTREPALAATA